MTQDYAQAYRVLGAIRLNQRRFGEATEALRTSVEMVSTDAIAHHYLGLALFYQDELVDAKLALQTAVFLDPENMNAQAALETVIEAQQ